MPALTELVREIRSGGGEASAYAADVSQFEQLYEHVEGLDQARGSFSEEARSFSLYTGLEMHPGLRWGLLAALAGVGVVLLRGRKPLR